VADGEEKEAGVPPARWSAIAPPRRSPFLFFILNFFTSKAPSLSPRHRSVLKSLKQTAKTPRSSHKVSEKTAKGRREYTSVQIGHGCWEREVSSTIPLLFFLLHELVRRCCWCERGSDSFLPVEKSTV